MNKMMIDRDKTKEAIWNSGLNCNAKLLMLAIYYLMDNQGRMDARSLPTVKVMTKIDSEQRWVKAIHDAVNAGYLKIESANNSDSIFYIVGLPND